MAIDVDLIYKMVGERVRRARANAEMSQVKLAKRLGRSRTSLVNIEHGRQHPPLHLIWQIAEILQTDPALLIPRHDEYQLTGQPLKLDSETIAKIEKAAIDDPETRLRLTEFIAKAKTAPPRRS